MTTHGYYKNPQTTNAPEFSKSQDEISTSEVKQSIPEKLNLKNVQESVNSGDQRTLSTTPLGFGYVKTNPLKMSESLSEDDLDTNLPPGMPSPREFRSRVMGATGLHHGQNRPSETSACYMPTSQNSIASANFGGQNRNYPGVLSGDMPYIDSDCGQPLRTHNSTSEFGKLKIGIDGVIKVRSAVAENLPSSSEIKSTNNYINSKELSKNENLSREIND